MKTMTCIWKTKNQLLMAAAVIILLAASQELFAATPVVQPQFERTRQNNPVSMKVSGTDADGHALTFRIGSNSSHGSAAQVGSNEFTYTPAAGYLGNDSFTYIANDGTVDSAPATVYIYVEPSALTAIIEVNEAQWLVDRRASGTAYSEVKITSSYAPFPVFFEGWRSGPRDDIASYRWEITDNYTHQVIHTFEGFNMAYVFEPDFVEGEAERTYTIKLVVEDALGGTNETNAIVNPKEGTSVSQITVKKRDVDKNNPADGITYYVDALQGNDSWSGTYQEPIDLNVDGTADDGPWQTAMYAFSGMLNKRYKPGDQILFKRGETFDITAGQITTAHWQTGYGYAFGAYGDPNDPKPLMKLAGGTGVIFNNIGSGLIYASWSDLDFYLTQETDFDEEGYFKLQTYTAASLYFSAGETENIMFLRCDVRKFGGAITIPGNFTTAEKSGVFVIGCNMVDSLGAQLYTVASRVAFLNNHCQRSFSHTAYISCINVGVVNGNVFAEPTGFQYPPTTPPAVRPLHAFRLSGGYEGGSPYTNNVVISNNEFIGWKDYRYIDNPNPRYTQTLVHLGPNDPAFMVMRDVIFENNSVFDSQIPLNIGCYQNLLVRNNTISTVDTVGNSRILLGGFHRWDFVPLKNVRIVNNTITAPAMSGGTSAIFNINPYTNRPPYAGSSRYENITIENNTIVMDGGLSRLVRFIEVIDPEQIKEIKSDYQTVFASSENSLFQVGGTYNVPMPEYVFSLAGWRNYTGNPANNCGFMHDGNTTVSLGVSTSADFIADKTTATVGEVITFTDLSSSSPLVWRWDFGDSTSSYEQNPMHSFNKAGTYTITLMATSTGGSNTVTKEGYISVSEESTMPLGDVNGDTEVSAFDAALAAMLAVELDITPHLNGYPLASARLAADFDGSGSIDAYDAALIARKAVGL